MTKFKTKIGPKGQIVIPKPIREEYHLPPGTALLIEDRPEGIYLWKAEKNLGDLFEELALRGKVRKGVKIDSDKLYDEEMRQRLKDVLRRR